MENQSSKRFSEFSWKFRWSKFPRQVGWRTSPALASDFKSNPVTGPCCCPPLGLFHFVTWLEPPDLRASRTT